MNPNEMYQTSSAKHAAVTNGDIVISQHVINTLRSLPTSERQNIATALVSKMLLGVEYDNLEPVESMIYSILSFYIRQDSARNVSR